MNIFYLLKPKAFVSFIYDDNTIRQGLEKLRAHHFTAIPVLSRNGEYVGTVSEGDFLWHIVDMKSDGIKTQEKYSVRDIIDTSKYKPVTVETGMDDLFKATMVQNFVPVIDDKKSFVGIVTRTDIIKYFYDKDK